MSDYGVFLRCADVPEKTIEEFEEAARAAGISKKKALVAIVASARGSKDGIAGAIIRGQAKAVAAPPTTESRDFGTHVPDEVRAELWRVSAAFGITNPNAGRLLLLEAADRFEKIFGALAAIEDS